MQMDIQHTLQKRMEEIHKRNCVEIKQLRLKYLETLRREKWRKRKRGNRKFGKLQSN